MDTLKFTTHPDIYGMKIASMSISELLPNRPAATMIPDDNAREIIRYFIDVQKRAKFVGVISSHAQIPKTDIFPTCTLQREKGVISFHVQKNTVIIFHLVSIVKYNNRGYHMDRCYCIDLE